MLFNSNFKDVRIFYFSCFHWNPIPHFGPIPGKTLTLTLKTLTLTLKGLTLITLNFQFSNGGGEPPAYDPEYGDYSEEPPAQLIGE